MVRLLPPTGQAATGLLAASLPNPSGAMPLDAEDTFGPGVLLDWQVWLLTLGLVALFLPFWGRLRRYRHVTADGSPRVGAPKLALEVGIAALQGGYWALGVHSMLRGAFRSLIWDQVGSLVGCLGSGLED